MSMAMSNESFMSISEEFVIRTFNQMIDKKSRSDYQSDLRNLHQHPDRIFKEACQRLHELGSFRAITHSMIY